MKRKTLDIIVSTGLLILAGLMLVAGLVLTSNANFANDYVKTQLSAQNITFKTADTLTAEEKEQACLVQYAGQKLTTGKQAECYALHFIGLHLQSTAEGKTYAELGTVQGGLRAEITAATQANDTAKAAELQKQLQDVTGQRDTVFKGETLKGLLLSSYGFSEFGTKAAQAATVAYLGAVLLFLLAIAGFVHSLVTPRSKGFAVPEPEAFTPRKESVKA